MVPRGGLHTLQAQAKDVVSKAFSVSSTPVNLSESLHGREIWTGQAQNDGELTVQRTLLMKLKASPSGSDLNLMCKA